MPDLFSVKVPELATHLRDTAVAINQARTITAALAPWGRLPVKAALDACPRCGGHILGAVGSAVVRCAACGWRGERTC